MADEPMAAPPVGAREIDFNMSLLKVRKRKKKVNKAKRAAEEVTYLNIIAMVDVLTILLIFLLKSVSVASTAAPAQTLTLPYSTTKESPIEAAKIYITRTKIIVEEKEVAQIFNGTVEARWLSPSNNYMIPELSQALSNWLKWHLFFKGGQQGAGGQSLEILADKDTPYHIIMQVLYSAGRAHAEKEGHEVFFDNYRLLAMRSL